MNMSCKSAMPMSCNVFMNAKCYNWIEHVENNACVCVTNAIPVVKHYDVCDHLLYHTETVRDNCKE